MDTVSQRQVMGQNLRLILTNLAGVKTVEAPPPGFDPRKATLSDLMKYGIPARPDPAKFPKGAKIWDRILSRAHQMVVPVLKPRPEVKRSLYRPPVKGSATDTSSNWSRGSCSTEGLSTSFMENGRFPVSLRPAGPIPLREMGSGGRWPGSG